MTNARSALTIVEELYRTFREKDYAAFRALCDDDLEWVQNRGFPGGGSYRGAEAVVEHVFKSFDGEWDGWSYRVDEMIDGGDAVVVLGRYAGRHRRTGAVVDSPAAHVYDFRSGKLRRFRQFADTHVIHEAMGGRGTDA